MNGVEVIQRLHEHRMWVNERLRSKAGMLTAVQLYRRFEIGRGSVWSSLVHLYAAELVWLEALQGNDNAGLVGDNDFDSLDDLALAWDALDERWRALLASITDKDLDRGVAKVSRSSGAGQMYVTPMHDVLLHVCTHAHYTSAQTVNMLRRLGIPPSELPDGMLITLSRKGNPR